MRPTPGFGLASGGGLPIVTALSGRAPLSSGDEPRATANDSPAPRGSRDRQRSDASPKAANGDKDAPSAQCTFGVARGKRRAMPAEQGRRGRPASARLRVLRRRRAGTRIWRRAGRCSSSPTDPLCRPRATLVLRARRCFCRSGAAERCPGARTSALAVSRLPPDSPACT
jgi:hypothetical protein